MGDIAYKICALALVIALVVVLVRQAWADGAIGVRLISSVVLCGGLVALSLPLINYITELSGMSGLGEYTEVLLKCLGVSLLSGICASVCRDCGENTIAGYAETAGKLEILILSLPLLRKMVETAMSLLEMLP